MFSSVENNSGNVPAFLIKLWSLVEDPSTDELIHWDTGGTSFHVHDQQRFSREILPLYFKHSNIASFVRQLNMYGFRKVAHIDQGGLRIEKDDLQFQHQFFQKGDRDMLQYIKRKVSNPLVRPADTIVTTNSDEVSRVLTEVKQVKSKQESTDQNLEYIKRENKLLWREVALLRQKHHKQQQIVNKLIQFLVSLVSSSRSGLTIPGLRRMPLAIGDTSQVQAQQMQQPVHAQVITDAASTNTIANLIQDNLTHPGASVGLQSNNMLKQETTSLDDSDFIINDGEYTIESPRGDLLLSPTPDSGGPIIHELTTETMPTPGVNVISNIPAQPILVKNEAAGANAGNVKTPINFLVLPQVQVQSQFGSAPSTGAANIIHPSLSASPAPHSRLSSPAPSFLMSPKIEPAPSLEDALNFGLNMSSSNISTLGKPVATQPKVSLLPGNNTVSVFTNPRKKRPGDNSSEQESGLSPAKKAMPSTGAMALTQPRVLTMSSASSTPAVSKAGPQTKLAGISPAQAASLNNLVQANSDLNTSVLAPAATKPSATPATSSSLLASNQNNSADAMALAAAGSNKDADDPMLASEQLELLTSDLDGLKGILQDQYKVDPNFLMELFDLSNPWGLEPEKEELKIETDKDTASTSGTEIGNITGQELVEYNPQDNLFPDLFVGDSLVGDIDDID